MMGRPEESRLKAGPPVSTFWLEVSMKRLLFVSLVALGAGCAHQEAQTQPPPESQTQPPGTQTPESQTPPSAAPGAQAQAPASPAGPMGQFSYTSGEGSFTVGLTPTDITGPNVLLSRTPQTLRGRLVNRTLDVRWTDDTVTGSYDNQPVNLRVEPTEGGSRVRGLWGGRIGDFTFTDKVLDGRIGRCAYTLEPEGDHYYGHSTCRSRNPTNTRITLPEGIKPPLNGEQAAILAVLLGQ